MLKYEYRMEDAPHTLSAETLDQLSEDGWELVSIVRHPAEKAHRLAHDQTETAAFSRYTFKRPKVSEEPQPKRTQVDNPVPHTKVER